MNFFFKSKQAKQQSTDEEHSLHHALNKIQTRFTNFFQIPNVSINMKTDASSSSSSSSSSKSPSLDDDQCKKNLSLSAKEIKQRLNDIPVHRLRDPHHQRPAAVKSGVVEERRARFYSLFSEPDAEDFLRKMKSIEANRNKDLKIISVPLSEIIEEKFVTTRLVPNMAEVKNAVKVKEHRNIQVFIQVFGV